MAKKGSKKNPLILRLADESRVESITEICYKNDWQFILGIEPDQEEDLSDLIHYRNDNRLSPRACKSSLRYRVEPGMRDPGSIFTLV